MITEPNGCIELTELSRSTRSKVGRQRPLAPIADDDRSPISRAQRAKLKSHRDDTKVAQGKRSAALGNESKMNLILFSKSGFPGHRPGKPDFEKRWGGGVRITQGDGLGGLALGYDCSAPFGALDGKPSTYRDSQSRLTFVYHCTYMPRPLPP